MRIYFIHDGRHQQGPFNIDELKARTIFKDTPVWKRGDAEWVTAQDLPELKSIIADISSFSFSGSQASKQPDSGITSKKPGFTIGRLLGLSSFYGGKKNLRG